MKNMQLQGDHTSHRLGYPTYSTKMDKENTSAFAKMPIKKNSIQA